MSTILFQLHIKMGKTAEWIEKNQTSSPPFIRKGKCGWFSDDSAARWSDQPLFPEEISSFQVKPCPFLPFFSPSMATIEDHADFKASTDTFLHALKYVPGSDRYQRGLDSLYESSETPTPENETPETPTPENETPETPTPENETPNQPSNLCTSDEYFDVTECVATTTCGDDEYQTTPPTATSDRVCTATTKCGDYEYQTTPHTATSDRVCAAITTCGDDEYETTPPTATSDRVCGNIRYFGHRWRTNASNRSLTYEGYASECTLPTYEQLCPEGIGGTPAGIVESASVANREVVMNSDGTASFKYDTWVPIQEQENGNKWVQVGDRRPHPSYSTKRGVCSPHSLWTESVQPTWANDTQGSGFKGVVACLPGTHFSEK